MAATCRLGTLASNWKWVFHPKLYQQSAEAKWLERSPHHVQGSMSAFLKIDLGPFACQVWESAYMLGACVLLLHLLFVRLLRYRRRDRLARPCNHKARLSLSRMSLQEAHHILLELAELEFPTTFSISIFFAIFKVSAPQYLIPAL